MDQIKDILNTLQGYGGQPSQALSGQPTQALSGTVENTLQTMVTVVKDCLANGQTASEYLAKLMTHPVVVSFFIGVALGSMISQMAKDYWKNDDQPQSK